MKLLRFLLTVVGTFLWAAAISVVAFYLVWVEGWAKDLDAFRGRK